MRHEYYRYGREELLTHNPLIKCDIFDSKEDVFRVIADEMIETIRIHNDKGRHTVFICPVGPVGQYPYFVERVNTEGLNLKNVWFINMDEYLDENKEWISEDHPLSFRGFMNRSVYSMIHPELLMPEKQRIFPDPHQPKAIADLIKKLGGVDLAIGGIGINGHVAFNEADASMSEAEFLQLGTRVLEITPETRTANAIGDFMGALEDMPRYCVTIGMAQIAAARKIRLGVFRSWHKAVLRRTLYGETSADFPVTLLRKHPDILLWCTEYVAELDS